MKDQSWTRWREGGRRDLIHSSEVWQYFKASKLSVGSIQISSRQFVYFSTPSRLNDLRGGTGTSVVRLIADPDVGEESSRGGRGGGVENGTQFSRIGQLSSYRT